MMMVMVFLHTIQDNRQNETYNIFLSEYVSYEMVQTYSTGNLVIFCCNVFLINSKLGYDLVIRNILNT